MQISKYVVAAVASVLTLATTIPSATAREQAVLSKIQKTLAAKKYVYLTHAFGAGYPSVATFPDETRKTSYWYHRRPDAMGSGVFPEVFSHVGQWGTHVDQSSAEENGERIMAKFLPAHTLRCAPIGQVWLISA